MSNNPVPVSPQQIISTHARTSFSFAARFLPQPQRVDAVNLYAFFRTLDDLVDDSPRSAGTSAISSELDAWQEWLTDRSMNGPREPLASNVAGVIDAYNIPIDVFEQMIVGLRADIEPREIVTDAELQTYCYQVASTVGYAMAHVLGATSPHALAAAERLGAAMQLTNILRDIGEDLAADRVYVPLRLLEAHGLCKADLFEMLTERSEPDERFRELVRGQVRQAHLLYDQAMPGIWLLPEECRYPILVASRLYRRLLTIIERNGYDTLHRRAATSRLDKAQEALISWSLVTRARFSRHSVAQPARSAATGSAIEMRGD